MKVRTTKKVCRQLTPSQYEYRSNGHRQTCSTTATVNKYGIETLEIHLSFSIFVDS